METLELLGIKKQLNSDYISMFFANGLVKEVYIEKCGFIVNDSDSVNVKIAEYEDLKEWDGENHKTIGKDEERIKKCTIEANRDVIEDYMYKLGIFSNKIEVNLSIIESKEICNLESSISSLSCSISMLEHEISQMKS
jgi:hypothetical protein